MKSPRKGHLLEVSLGSLRPNPDQPRKTFDEQALQSLADSIRQHGLLQPITIKRDPDHQKRYLIVAGERRFRAFQRLGRDTIPAVLTLGKADELGLIENLQRESLSPIEEATALANLKERYDYTHEELARIVGKSRSTITHLLKLNTLPDDIRRESSTSHRASRSQLIEISKEDDPVEQRRLWKLVKAGGTIQQLRREKRSSKRGKSDPPSVQIRRTPSEFSAAAVAVTTGDPLIDRMNALLVEIERLVDDGAPIPDERYEALLEFYRRFIDLIEREAAKQHR